MEKLLSKQYKTKGGNHATNLMSQRTKNIFLAVRGTKIFLPAHGKQQKNQPYSGCIILVNQ